MNVGLALQIIRLVRGYRQCEVARMIGYSPPHLSRIETGKDKAWKPTAEALCGLYGVQMSDVERIAADPAAALGIGG